MPSTNRKQENARLRVVAKRLRKEYLMSLVLMYVILSYYLMQAGLKNSPILIFNIPALDVALSIIMLILAAWLLHRSGTSQEGKSSSYHILDSGRAWYSWGTHIWHRFPEVYPRSYAAKSERFVLGNVHRNRGSRSISIYLFPCSSLGENEHEGI